MRLVIYIQLMLGDRDIQLDGFKKLCKRQHRQKWRCHLWSCTSSCKYFGCAHCRGLCCRERASVTDGFWREQATLSGRKRRRVTPVLVGLSVEIQTEARAMVG